MLVLNDITKYWTTGTIFGRKHTMVLDGISMSFDRGKITALIGNSGCGKTTLSKIATGIIDPSSGTVSLDGVPFTENNFRENRWQIQMVFQHPEGALNPRIKIEDSIKEVLRKVGCPGNRLKERMDEICAEMGIQSQLLKRYPNQISGGEIQRIVLARVMMFQPKYLFLDEPTSMLDPSVQANIFGLILKKTRKFNSGVVIVTHDLDIVSNLADNVAFLEDGRIQAYGATEEVRKVATDLFGSWDEQKDIRRITSEHPPTDNSQRI